MNTPERAEAFLKRLHGEWRVEFDEGEFSFRTEQTIVPFGLWTMADSTFPDMDDSAPHMQIRITLGYNPKTNRIAGTWIASSMAHLWIYDGELDESGDALHLHAEGPKMDGTEGSEPYRDTLTFLDNDHYTLTACLQDESGAWKAPFMTTHYYRK